MPLLKYDTVESTYGIPHWINLSFYKSSETVRYCNSRFLSTSKIRQQHAQQAHFKSNFLFILFLVSFNLKKTETILPGYHVNEDNYLKSLKETDYMFETMAA